MVNSLPMTSTPAKENGTRAALTLAIGHPLDQVLPHADLRAARVPKGAVEVAGAHATDVVQPPGAAGALGPGGVAAGAGRVARVVASVVGEAQEVVAGHALVVGPPGVVIAVRAARHQALARPPAPEARGRRGRGWGEGRGAGEG
ncbi:uncharacterized protein PG998_002198 [Apiospora kogelbergensis]|uniref:uncharacterized protein n=1 Tax=Apiospora kogelbergensis TaxID=1337665 RepID=UPI0031321590